MVPAKYPPNVKLENFYNSKVIKLGELCVPWFVRLWGFYSSAKLTLISWWKGYFLVEKIPINTRNLWDPFLIGLPSIVVRRGVQDISLLGFLETTHAMNVTRGFSRSFSFGSFASRDLPVTPPPRPCHTSVCLKEYNCRVSHPSRLWARLLIFRMPRPSVFTSSSLMYALVIYIHLFGDFIPISCPLTPRVRCTIFWTDTGVTVTPSSRELCLDWQGN